MSILVEMRYKPERALKHCILHCCGIYHFCRVEMRYKPERALKPIGITMLVDSYTVEMRYKPERALKHTQPCDSGLSLDECRNEV